MALVIAAAEYGGELLTGISTGTASCTDLSRTMDNTSHTSNSTSSVINHPNSGFTILAVNEFESNRKRMSVLVRRKDGGPAVLYVKGNVIPFSLRYMSSL